LQEIENVKVKPKKGDLIVRGTEKEGSNASMVFSTDLPDQYTIFIQVQLPENLSSKKRQALENFSFGVEVASDLGSPPAEAVGFEVQATPDGIAQSFTFTLAAIQDVFPIALPRISTRTAVTNIVIKDSTSVTIGGIFEYENGEKEIQTTKVPLLGDLPILRYLFRNMGKQNSLKQKNLMIFITPMIVELE
jgi:hypothetical protein